MIGKSWIFGLGLMALVLWFVLAAANLYLGDLNQDEGWYLYAARLLRQGKLPYVDFASTQGPVMPLVYALAQPLVDRWGVAGGRFFTALLGFTCSLCAAWLTSRLVPPEKRNSAALIAFAFTGMNVYQSYFCTIVKTYSLSGLLLILGLLVLSFARGKRSSLLVPRPAGPDNADAAPRALSWSPVTPPGNP